MVDLVEAGGDVTFNDPLVPAGAEQVDLSDGVLCPATGAEAVTARLEVRLENRLKHQLEGTLDDAISHGRYPQTAAFHGAWFGNHPLAHRHRLKPPSPQVGS